jgi:hypothetical protein
MQKKFIAVVRNLEVTLGPDTAELGMRFGLHSGAVTAGVLRGMAYVSDRRCVCTCTMAGSSNIINHISNHRRTARFQLFWDTGRC